MADEGAVDFEKLARNAVTSRLAEAADAPAQAAEIASLYIIQAIKSPANAQAPGLVRGVCRGVASGMMFLMKDMPEAAIQILLRMARIAQEVHLDPGNLMTWAMEGLADIAPIMGIQISGEIRDRIDEKFMGAGAVFSQLCDKARKSGS